MFKRFRVLLQKTFLTPQFGLVFLGLILAYLNYQPHTWLSGWDNLHPEFNLNLDIKRSLFALWQEYRGLGLLGGMAHAADLPRQIFLLVCSTFVPTQFLRYLWTFLMLIIGPLGVYHLASHSLLRKFSKPTRKIAGFFAGLFYLLNLATVQVFYTPFETFTSFYGFLPWLLLSVVLYLQVASKKRLIFLCVILFLSTPSFYTQTLFVVFGLVLIPILISHYIYRHFSWYAFKQIVVVLGTIFSINAFWLLPVTYFTLTSSSIPVNAAQNQVATREVIARNQEFGRIQDVVLLKGYWFDYVDLSVNNRFGLLMGPWVNHSNSTAIQVIGYSFFLLILVGTIYTLRRKLIYGLAFILAGLIAIFFLINLNPPTGQIFNVFQNSFPLAKEFFRSAFTKWSPVAELSYSLLFSVGVIFLLDMFSFLHYRFTTFITSFTLILGLIVFAAPAFQGYLIYPSMRVSIPTEYFDLFTYMKTQNPSSRLMNLPQHTFWGWEFYNWGYRGSGFLWYGLEQPILDRAFDVWSPYSQDYYTQIQHAIYAQSQPELTAIFEKYGVSWVLVDDNLVVPGSDNTTPLYIPQIKQMLAGLSNVHLEKDFKSLHLYKVDLQSAPQNFVVTTKSDAYIPLEFTPTASASNMVETPNQNRSTNDSKAHNCDNFNSTLYTQTNTTDEIIYRAIHADACDHFLYPELNHGLSYQFKITHRNLAGSPFFVCIEDYVSKQCLVYRYLPSSPDWTTTTLEIPAMKEGEFGYTLHLYTYSLNHEPSSNSWHQIEITPGPVKSPVNLSPIPQPLVSTKDVQHNSYSLYTVVATAPNPYGLLVLDQSFDHGWKAYIVDDIRPSNVVQKYLTALFLQPLPESNHMKIHDWANGWLIPEGDHTILLIYQPQLWQFLGFSLLPLPLLLVLFAHRKK